MLHLVLVSPLSPPVTGPQSFLLRDDLDTVTYPGQSFRMSLQVTCLGSLIRGRNIPRDDAVSSWVRLVKEVMVLACLTTGEAGLEHLRLCLLDFSTVKSLSLPLRLIHVLGEVSEALRGPQWRPQDS